MSERGTATPLVAPAIDAAAVSVDGVESNGKGTGVRAHLTAGS
jgi:hypothetical protein